MVEPPEQEENDAQTGFPPDSSGGGAGGNASGPVPPAAPTSDGQLDEEGVARNAILGEILSLMESTSSAAQAGQLEDDLPPEGFLIAQASEMTVTEPTTPSTGEAEAATDIDRALHQARQLTEEQVIDFGGQKEPTVAPAVTPQPQAVERPVVPSTPLPSEPMLTQAAAAAATGQPTTERPKAAVPAQAAEAKPATKIVPAPSQPTPSQPAEAKSATEVVRAPEKPTPAQLATQTTRIDRPARIVRSAKMLGRTLNAILHIILLPFRIPARLFILLAIERRIVTQFVLRYSRQLLVLLSFLVGMAWLLVGLTNLSLLAIILAIALLFPAFFFAIGVLK
ncbi:MAG: hypothetical protein RDV41_04405 [Planctomycetota bacterium]|nr:hypothetical protein [Planctomycetota bacterium]